MSENDTLRIDGSFKHVQFTKEEDGLSLHVSEGGGQFVPRHYIDIRIKKDDVEKLKEFLK